MECNVLQQQHNSSELHHTDDHCALADLSHWDKLPVGSTVPLSTVRPLRQCPSPNL